MAPRRTGEGSSPPGSTGGDGRLRPAVALGVAASSAAVLILEIALISVFAVTQFYHFAFLTVSMALLGFGASGSALAAFPGLGRGGPRRWSVLAIAQALTTVLAYGVTNALPFDSFAIAWDRRQILYLALYYLALAVPFFFGGAVIGTLLAEAGEGTAGSHRVYAASLVGSGMGCLVALWGLDVAGGERIIAVAAAVATSGALAFASAAPPGRGLLVGEAGAGAVLVVLVFLTPPFLDMRLSPYKGLSAALRYPGAEVLDTAWERGTRVDHVRSDGIRSLPGLSFTYPGAPPSQDGVTFDGDDLSPIPRVAPGDADFVPYLLGSVPYQLRPAASALVLEPRGGLDVLVALAAGAHSVTAVEPNGAAVEASRRTPGSPYPDRRVTVVASEPRTHVERTRDSFDVVVLSLIAPYRPVASGAYSLAEDYRLTVEAFEQYLARLEPGGVLAAMRWVQAPPSEEMRLLAVAAAALRSSGGDPASSIVVLRGYANALVLVRPGGYSPSDVAVIESFAESRRFDIVLAPGLGSSAANRFNVVPDDEYHALAVSLVGPSDPADVYASYEFDIAPPTDDQPFFGHFFKWSQAEQVLDNLGRTWQPFGGAGYFVLIALLVLSAGGAVLLIVLPLMASRRLRAARTGATRLRWWTFGYFSLLGVGFLFVELPIVQQYILLTGNPARALGVVLFAILVSSGAGSLLSRRLPWRPTASVLAVSIIAYGVWLDDLTHGLLSAPLPLRMLAGALAMVPLGFLMGTMFPRGLARLEGVAPELVPWAWGINGTVSVISAAASALLALTAGFSFVILLGAACYAAAALLAGRRTPAPA